MIHDQDAERSRRSILRLTRRVIIVVVMLVGFALICLKPEAAWPIVVLIGILTTYALLIEYFNRDVPLQLREILVAVDELQQTSERAPDVRRVPMRLVNESAYQRLVALVKTSEEP